VVLSFFAVEIGKLTHDAEMRAFFVSSGLPGWVNYCVIAAEILLSLALFRRGALVAAAAGLGCLMAGAILTHWRNGDPFSDSLEPFHLLVLLACVLVLAPRRGGRAIKIELPAAGMRGSDGMPAGRQ
jgi:uncharacterized membrane protein YphA (DoxX/SURF4 family)